MKKVFFLFAVVFLAAAMGACSGKKQATDETAQTTVEGTHAQLIVQGACEMCKARIEKAAKEIEGVVGAEWNVDTKELHLTFDPAKTSVEAISKAVAKVGHDTEKDTADEAVYADLPACCRYR